MLPSKKTKTFLTALLISNTFLIAAWTMLFFGMKAKNEHTSELSNTLEEKQAAQNSEISIQKILDDTASKRDELDSYLVRKDTIVAFLSGIEGIGAFTNTKVHVNAVDESKPDESAIPMIHVNIVADGSWSGVYSVLLALESLPNKSMVTTVALHQGGGTDASGKPAGKGSWEGIFDLSVVGTGQ